MSDKVRVEFRKTFTRGHLSGISVRDRLTCVNMDEAVNWVDRVQQNIQDGYLEYFISEIHYVLEMEK